VNGYSVYGSTAQPRFPWPFSKVADDSTLLRENLGIELSLGVNIDVFPLDGWPDGASASRAHAIELRAYRAFILAYHLRTKPRDMHLKEALVTMARPLTSLMPIEMIVGRVSRRASRYSIATSSLVGVAVWGPPGRAPAQAYDGTVEMTFEGRPYPVPKGYDQILTALYGDYMQPPPPARQRSTHTFEAFRRP
jgi:lipopolysaccharide cholinephosphotransferase